MEIKLTKNQIERMIQIDKDLSVYDIEESAKKGCITLQSDNDAYSLSYFYVDCVNDEGEPCFDLEVNVDLNYNKSTFRYDNYIKFNIEDVDNFLKRIENIVK